LLARHCSTPNQHCQHPPARTTAKQCRIQPTEVVTFFARRFGPQQTSNQHSPFLVHTAQTDRECNKKPA
jgi:hypothetical protein